MPKTTAGLVLILTSITGLTNVVNAQQANKPAASSAINPVVVALPAAPVGNLNYVRMWDAFGPITDPDALMSADYRDVKETTEYIDGLGRKLQTVSKQLSPQLKDIVDPVVYDGFGREAIKAIPI